MKAFVTDYNTKIRILSSHSIVIILSPICWALNGVEKSYGFSPPVWLRMMNRIRIYAFDFHVFFLNQDSGINEPPSLELGEFSCKIPIPFYTLKFPPLIPLILII